MALVRNQGIRVYTANVIDLRNTHMPLYRQVNYRMKKEQVDDWAFDLSPMDKMMQPTYLDELGGATHLDSVRMEIQVRLKHDL